MSAETSFYVYVLFRLDGSPCYVGKGKGSRWSRHNRYGRNSHLNYIIAQAKDVGKELPVVKVRTNLSEQEAFEIERALISAIGRFYMGGPLANFTEGGEGAAGYKLTDAQRNAQSVRQRGRSLPEEWRRNISAGMKGKIKMTPEQRAKISAAHTGVKIAFGWWSTEEGRAKQRMNNPGHSGRRHSNDAKRKLRDAAIQQNARIAVVRSPSWAAMNSIRIQVTA